MPVAAVVGTAAEPSSRPSPDGRSGARSRPACVGAPSGAGLAPAGERSGRGHEDEEHDHAAEQHRPVGVEPEVDLHAPRHPDRQQR